jgi:hypothetical protein
MGLVDWETFFAAQLGASAALTGLLFVGISINMSRILAIPLLADRALQALALLSTILIGSTFLLVPNPPTALLGGGLAALGLGGWAFVTRLSRRVLRATDPKYRASRRLETGVIQVAMLSWVAAGVALVVIGDDGAYFTIAAITASFLEVVQISWVLLVEVNR